MTDDDLPLSLRNLSQGAAALAGLAREDLDPYSAEDLQLRIEMLEAEIRRVRDQIDRKKNRLSAAEALFSFKGG